MALSPRFIADKSSLSRMRHVAVANVPEPLILAGEVGTCDTDNVPTWDTWLCDYAAPPDAGARQHCLVAWIPPSHVDLADRGISVNPEGCIVWADGPDLERGTIYARVADELRQRRLVHP